MTYRVVDENGKRVLGEEHAGPRAATRAMMILNAHELKNGRAANYRVEPPVSPRPVEELDLSRRLKTSSKSSSRWLRVR